MRDVVFQVGSLVILQYVQITDPMQRIILLTAVLLIITGTTFAQPSSLAIALTGGYRPTPAYACQPGPENRFAPELQIESQLATFADQTLSAHGAVYYSYWHDGVTETSKVKLCSHGSTYSQREHTAGMRLFIVGGKGFLPVMVSAGLARQFASSEYIDGEDWGGAKGHDYRSAQTAAEVGLHVRIPIGAKLKLQGGVRRFVRIPARQHIIGAFIEDARKVYQIGVAYTLL